MRVIAFDRLLQALQRGGAADFAAQPESAIWSRWSRWSSAPRRGSATCWRGSRN